MSLAGLSRGEGTEGGERREKRTLQSIQIIGAHNARVGDHDVATLVRRVLDCGVEDGDLVFPFADVAFDELGFAVEFTQA